MKKICEFVKKHGIFLFLLSFIGFVFLGYIYKDNTFQAHDLSFHLANIQNLVENHLNVQAIMPRLANHLGYGLYIFYPFLPHFVYALVVAISSCCVIDSILFVNILVAIVSSIFMYFLSYRLFKSRKVAFLSALIYLLFPYRLGTITVRMALNENFSGLFMPLILLSFTYLFDENLQKGRFYFFFILGYVGLIFSHFVLALYFSIFVLFYLLFFFRKFQNRTVLFTFLKGVLFVSVLVLPNILLFLEHYGMDYLVYQENYVTSFGLIQDNILSFRDLLIPTKNYDWTIPFYLYLPAVICFIYSSYLAFKQHHSFLKLLFGIVLAGLFIVMSESFWRILPDVFYVIQFPWRLLLIVSVFFSLLAAFCVRKSKLWHFSLVVILFLLFAGGLVVKLSNRIYHWDYTTFDIEEGLGNLQEYYPSEYLKYTDYYANKEGIDVLKGNADIDVIRDDRSQNVLVFSIENSENLEIEFPKIYYKGYQLVDDEGHTLELEKDSVGLISAVIDEDGVYTLTYRGTFLYRLFSVLRILFVGFFLGYLVFRKLATIKRK